MEGLGRYRAVGMAPARGEIVGTDDDQPVADFAPAANMVGRCEAGDATRVVVVSKAGEAANLPEAARIKQQIDSLTAGQLAPLTLAEDTRVGRVGGKSLVGDRWSARTSESIGAHVSSP